MSQTVIQNNNNIKVGSVLLEVGTSLASMVNLGAIKGFKVGGLGVVNKLSFDNVDDISLFSKGNQFKAEFTLGEINWDNIQMLNDGQVVVTSQAGTLQTVVAEAHGTGWTVGQPIAMNFKNGDNTIVGAIVVKAGAPTLVLNTDYRTYVADGSNGVKGFTYVVPLTAQTLAITFGYTYTPYASKTITFNASGKKIGKYFRITNTDQNGKTFVFAMQGTSNVNPIEITFGSDNESSVAEMPMSLEGTAVNIIDQQL